MIRIVQHSTQTSRFGSAALETAIALPVFLLISAFLLTSITLQKADILMMQSIDQVTQEASLLVPVISCGIDAAEVAVGVVDKLTATEGSSGEEDAKKAAQSVVGGIGAVFDLFGITPEDTLTTILFGRVIRDRITSVYSSFCGSEVLSSRISDVSVYVDIDHEKHVIWLRVYYLWNTIFGQSERMITSAMPVYGDIEFALPETEESSDEKDAVWLKGNLERGQELRATFGANLPFSYPVIAKWSNQTATSIKSIDLTAPEYGTPGAVEEKINSEIDDLANFTGTPNGFGREEILIREEDISQRELVVIIPENSPTQAYEELLQCKAYADSKGVILIIKKHGESYRFIEKNKENDSEESENIV